MDKVLIEESNVELLELFDKVSEDAKKEKNSVPPINEILYWWTRKPLVVGRAIILTSTLNDIKMVKDLMGLGREKRAYTYIPDASVYAKKLDPSKIKVLDPFGGAGNLLFEAKRLGLDCTASDYNPVAYLLEKAVLEYPSKYGQKLAQDFEKYANIVIKKTQEEIGRFYEKNDLVYLWVWCIKCPHCDQRVPLTNQMFIANTSKNKIGIRFKVTKDKNFETELELNMKESEGKKFTQKGGSAICISCKNTINHEELTSDIAKRKDRELVAKEIQVNKKREYVLATAADKKLFEKASNYLKLKWEQYKKENLIPMEDIKPSHRDTLGPFGIKQWNDFFSDRQLLVMVTLLRNIRQVCDEIKDVDHKKIIALYLGMLLCKHVNSNSLGVVWNARRETPEHALLLRRPSFVSNHVESNPFNKVRGSLTNVISAIYDAIIFAAINKNPAIAILKSVLRLDQYAGKYDLIITDPPYGYDVQYGELSEFFYVWLFRTVGLYFPELPSRVQLDEDLCESKFRFSTRQLAQDFFERGLKNAFISMNKALKDDGILVVFFAHSSLDAWNILLESIRESKFKVVSSYAIHTENVSNVISRGKTSFLSSVVVICRKINSSSEAYFEDIVPAIEDKIKNMLSIIALEKILLLPITDLLIMVYGKVLEAVTQHTVLKTYQKDFDPNYENLLAYARDFIMREIVAKLTGRSLNLIGPQMSFYLLTKIFYRGILSSDDSLKVARTYGIDAQKLYEQKLGKREEGVLKLYYLHEQEVEKRPEEIDDKNLYEQLSYLAQTASKHGTSKVVSILSHAGKNFKVDDLKQIISLLLKSLRVRLNKGEQLNIQEQKELEILETLSDVFGIKTTENSLDSFFDKK